jgi:hypothetical protein
MASCTIQKRLYRPGFYIDRSESGNRGIHTHHSSKKEIGEPAFSPTDLQDELGKKVENQASTHLSKAIDIYDTLQQIEIWPQDTFIVDDENNKLSTRERIRLLLKKKDQVYGEQLVPEAKTANTLMLIGLFYLLGSVFFMYLFFPVALVYNIIAWDKYKHEPERYSATNLVLIRRTFIFLAINILFPFLLAGIILISFL